MLISHKIGSILTYDLRNGAVGAFPTRPLPLMQQVAVDPKKIHYCAGRTTRLCMALTLIMYRGLIDLGRWFKKYTYKLLTYNTKE